MIIKACTIQRGTGIFSTIAGMVLMGMLFSVSLSAAAEDDAPVVRSHTVLLTVDPGVGGLGQGEERACLDLDMANLFVRTGQRATLFLGIDGVKLADAKFWEFHNPRCWDATNEIYVPMKGLLDAYMEAGGKVLVCPICWGPRAQQGIVRELIPGAEFGDSKSIPKTFLRAKNVVSF